MQSVSYPFDWINLSNIQSISPLLRNGFFDLISSWEKSDFPSDLLSSDKFLVKDLSLRFPHEFDVNPNIHIDEICDRYTRRLIRLRNDIRHTNVVFLRVVELEYGNYPPETDEMYNCHVEGLVASLAQQCGHENFLLLIFSKSLPFDFIPASPKVILIKNSVPFDNGFFASDIRYLQGDAIFSFYRDFFSRFEKLVQSDSCVTSDLVQNVYDADRTRVLVELSN